jgi:hypothetical protein
MDAAVHILRAVWVVEGATWLETATDGEEGELLCTGSSVGGMADIRREESGCDGLDNVGGLLDLCTRSGGELGRTFG